MRTPVRRRGIALILALLVLILLVVVVGQLTYTTRIDLQIARNAADDQAALHAARGGLEFAKALLRDDLTHNQHDGMADRWARLTKPIEVGKTKVTVTVEDEDRKFNLLLLRSEDETLKTWAEETLKRLIELAREASEEEGETPADQLADNLITWIQEGKVPGVSSEDQTFSEQGSEDSIPPLTIGEFLAVEGWTRSVLFGPPEKRRSPGNEDDEGFEATLDEPIAKPGSLDELLGKTPKTVKGLAPFLTLWTGGRININTVDPILLKSMSQYIDESTVERVVSERSGGGPSGPSEPGSEPDSDTDAGYDDKAFKSVAEVGKVEGMDDAGDETPFKEMRGYLTVGSQVFKITASASVRKVRRTIEVVLRREKDDFRVLWYKER